MSDAENIRDNSANRIWFVWPGVRQTASHRVSDYSCANERDVGLPNSDYVLFLWYCHQIQRAQAKRDIFPPYVAYRPRDRR